MIIIYIGFFLIFVTLIRKGNIKPEFGFFLVFIIMAFQSNIAGDFEGYKEYFELGEQARTAEDEPLWQFLNTFFRPAGFLVFNIMITAFELYTLLRLTKKYVHKDYQYLAPILFLFTNALMLIHMKAIRQVLTIEICMIPFLFDYETLKKPKWLYCFLPLPFAYFIHNSSLVSIVSISIYYLQGRFSILKKKSKAAISEFKLPVIATAIFWISYLLKETILTDYLVSLSQLAALEDFRLGGYMSMNEVGGTVFNLSWLIVFYDALMVFLGTWYFNLAQKQEKVLAVMSIIASFLDMFFFGMGSLMRVGYFYYIANIVVIPNIAFEIKKRWNNTISLLFIVICLGYAIKTTWPSFTSMEPELFGNYKFIFM